MSIVSLVRNNDRSAVRKARRGSAADEGKVCVLLTINEEPTNWGAVRLSLSPAERGTALSRFYNQRKDEVLANLRQHYAVDLADRMDQVPVMAVTIPKKQLGKVSSRKRLELSGLSPTVLARVDGMVKGFSPS